MSSAPLREGSIFTDPRAVFATATLCCLLWGSAFPAIKAGYAVFAIAPADVPSQMLFAGYRFALAGAILLAYAALSGRKLWLTPRQGGQVLLLGLTQTSIQYVFFYIGLAYASGVKASIVNATTTFFSVLLAHFIYRNDRLNRGKSLGVLLGFAGVVAVNLRSAGLDFEFTLLGDRSAAAAREEVLEELWTVRESGGSITVGELERTIHAGASEGWGGVVQELVEDGSVTIPEALRPYMGGLDRIDRA